MTFGITLSNRGILLGLTMVPKLLALADAAEARPLLDSVWVGDALFVNQRLDALTLLAARRDHRPRISCVRLSGFHLSPRHHGRCDDTTATSDRGRAAAGRLTHRPNRGRCYSGRGNDWRGNHPATTARTADLVRRPDQSKPRPERPRAGIDRDGEP